MKQTMLSLSLLAGLYFGGVSAHADDKSAEVKLEKASALYKERTEATKVTEGLKLAREGQKEATKDELKYDLMVLEAKLLYWQGVHTTGDAKKVEIHNSGVEVANQAKALLPDFADAYYWSAAHLGRWGEAKGILASLSKKGEVIATLEAIFNLDTKAGAAGDTYEGYGADRILGRLYFKLPGFAGGSLATSLKHLDAAYLGGPEVALNVVFYAESLSTGTAAQKAQAKKILDELLAKDPKTLNPARIPETLEEFEQARKLKAQLGN